MLSVDEKNYNSDPSCPDAPSYSQQPLTTMAPQPQQPAAQNPPPLSLKLTNQLMASVFLEHLGKWRNSSLTKGKFKPAKIFKGAVEATPPPSPGGRASSNGPKHITGISFDDRGDQVITAAEDETFRLYNCRSGKQVSSFMYQIH